MSEPAQRELLIARGREVFTQYRRSSAGGMPALTPRPRHLLRLPPTPATAASPCAAAAADERLAPPPAAELTEGTRESLLLRAVACADGKLNKEDLTSAVHPAFVEALTIASTLSQEFCEAVHDGVDGQLERIAHEMSAACKALQPRAQALLAEHFLLRERELEAARAADGTRAQLASNQRKLELYRAQLASAHEERARGERDRGKRDRDDHGRTASQLFDGAATAATANSEGAEAEAAAARIRQEKEELSASLTAALSQLAEEKEAAELRQVSHSIISICHPIFHIYHRMYEASFTPHFLHLSHPIFPSCQTPSIP